MIRTGRALAPWIGLTLACFAVGSCCSAAKASNVVLVSIAPGTPSAADAEYKPAKPTIHKSKKERLIWVSPPGSKLNQISITIPPGSTPPFQKCTMTGSTCQISCDADGVCASGRIHDNWAAPPAGFYYYEYQAAFSAAPIADPGFIIKP